MRNNPVRPTSTQSTKTEPQSHSIYYTCYVDVLNIFTHHYDGLIVIIPPFLFLPFMLGTEDTAPRCMWLFWVMLTYWVTEVIPVNITAIIPIFALPLLDIMPADVVSEIYCQDLEVMFLTTFMSFCIVEYSGLHIRLALKVLLIAGCSLRRIHFGICAMSTFVSIYISNTAVTAMMLPIVYTILTELSSGGIVKQYHDDDEHLPPKERRPSRTATCLYLSIAYSTSIGGIGSLVGSSRNAIMKATYEHNFPNATEEMNFIAFHEYNMPIVIVSTILMYILMDILFMGLFRPHSQDAQDVSVDAEGVKAIHDIIEAKYDELGPITTIEITAAISMLVFVVLYITRNPCDGPGWAHLFDWYNDIGNSVSSAIILIAIFSLPGNYKFLKFWSKESLEKTPPLLTWDFLARKIPFGLLFLLGGGSILGEAADLSSLSAIIEEYLCVLEVLPLPILLLTFITASTLLTNLTPTIINIVLSVSAIMAVDLKVHPLYLIMPAGLACNMGFILPVAHPANAMVQHFAHIRIKTMIVAGAVISVPTILTIWIFAQTWSYFIFHNLSEYPKWADENTIIRPTPQ